MVEAFRRRHPKLPQVACFDTAFHRTMPRVATLLPLPRRFAAKGIERYGFHGLSYAYLLEELGRIARSRGILEGFVLTEPDNDAANALYRSLGGERVESVMWDFQYAGD
mgnify:CR=1 FL=1